MGSTTALSWFSKWLLLCPFILGVGAALEARVPDHPQTGPLDPSPYLCPFNYMPSWQPVASGCAVCLLLTDARPSPPPHCPVLLLSEARIINLDGIPYLLGYCCTVSLPLTEDECKQRLCFMANSVPGVGTVCTRHRCLLNDT